MDKDSIKEGITQGASFIVWALIVAFLLLVCFTAVLGLWEVFLWIVENYGVSKWDLWKR